MPAGRDALVDPPASAAAKKLTPEPVEAALEILDWDATHEGAAISGDHAFTWRFAVRNRSSGVIRGVLTLSPVTREGFTLDPIGAEVLVLGPGESMKRETSVRMAAGDVSRLRRWELDWVRTH